MYQKHFGFKQRLFPADATGGAVFVGPQQAAAITRLKRALAATDAVVTVTGPVGVGKTTVVRRALEAVSPSRIVATIERMRLGPDDVLELLLSEFGISSQPTGTIQKFAAFKRILNEWAARQIRVFVIVEDPQRVGIDALIELEALTAADSGKSTGANIILTGDPEVDELIDTPALARLRQRTRLRHAVRPFSAPEVLGYLKHCMRAAGGDLDDIVTPGTVELVYRYTEGIPRLIDNLFDSLLEAAAEAKVSKLTPQMVQKVAIVVYGLTPPPELPAPAAVAQPAPVAPPDPLVDPEPTIVEEKPEMAAPHPEPPPAAPGAEPATDPDPVVVAGLEISLPDGSPPEPDSLDESIEATQPVRILPEILPPQPSEPAATPAAESGPPAPDRIDGSAADDTKNVKKPDIEALMGRTPAPAPQPTPEAPPDPEPAIESPELPELSLDDLPELTDVAPAEDDELPVLSDSMRIHPEKEKAKAAPAPDAGPESGKKPGVPQTDIDALEAALSAARAQSAEADAAAAPAEAAEPPVDAVEASVPELTLDESLEDARRDQRRELDELAEQLGKAQTLDDISDKMAETLFGDEDLNRIAAEVVANPPPEAANQADAGEPASAPEAAGTDSGKTGTFDMTMSERYRMVNSLNASPPPANPKQQEVAHISLGDTSKTRLPPAPTGETPVSIEDQIETALTQTRKGLTALDIPEPPAPPPEQDETENGKGMFGLLKRSPKG